MAPKPEVTPPASAPIPPPTNVPIGPNAEPSWAPIAAPWSAPDAALPAINLLDPTPLLAATFSALPANKLAASPA